MTDLRVVSHIRDYLKIKIFECVSVRRLEKAREYEREKRNQSFLCIFFHKENSKLQHIRLLGWSFLYQNFQFHKHLNFWLKILFLCCSNIKRSIRRDWILFLAQKKKRKARKCRKRKIISRQQQREEFSSHFFLPFIEPCQT
jgi:hypothetical protein